MAFKKLKLFCEYEKLKQFNLTIMIALLLPMFGAAGFSLIYLLLGGGLGGAILIFIIAKMFGK
ncbi:MAG TPA: hypothetical protein VFC85_00360 [Verrucomicrobiae bacterium]|nr:hypothetical protein [Verrucomicrobiae bacterium]